MLITIAEKIIGLPLCLKGGGHQLNETHEFIAILGNPKICSAMALAMSIYRTLCVLVLKQFTENILFDTLYLMALFRW